MKTMILSVAHRPMELPRNNGCLPVMAGAAMLPHRPDHYWTCDDTGENISLKNGEYCELTALYWAWKNLDTDILGLCHYRRFFSSKRYPGSFLQPDEAERLLEDCDVILPAGRNYVIETNRSQYANSHHQEDLDLAGQIIRDRHPAYVGYFDRRMSMSRGHRFNMFVMKKSLADEYCSWLFDILSEMEKKLDISGYSERDRRVFGLVAERLLDVWIDCNQLRSSDLDYIFIGKEHMMRKAAGMIGRKIRAGVRKTKMHTGGKQ